MEAQCDDAGYRWSLFPPRLDPTLKPGDVVHTMYDQLRAIVSEELKEEGPYAGRVKVAFEEDGKEYHIRPSRMMKIDRSQHQIIVTATTDGYRRLARALPTENDRCIDIGCSYGKCTAILASKTESVVGIDNAKEVIEAAREANPGIFFECVDAILDRQRLVEIAAEPQIVFLDIGGNRELDTLVVLIPLLQSLLKPEILVVKAVKLAKAASQIASDDGIIRSFSTWWESIQERTAQKMSQSGRRLGSVLNGTGVVSDKLMHPLQYPRMFLRNSKGFESPPKQICRYYNYLDCKRGDKCEHNHTACHCCGAEGHRAKDCVAYA